MDAPQSPRRPDQAAGAHVLHASLSQHAAAIQDEDLAGGKVLAHEEAGGRDVFGGLADGVADRIGSITAGAVVS
jgi:hypothetical protein